MEQYVRIEYGQMLKTFQSILEKEGLDAEKALQCARILTDNSFDGFDSHGVLRFEDFADRMKNGGMDKSAEPMIIRSEKAFECWDGNKGIGPLNAIAMSERAVDLANRFGIGIAAIRNTTHWMRGGTYGKHIAEHGCFGICWTNTKANMKAWGTDKEIIGNNPIVFSAPSSEERSIVLDMALSQYSYGKLTAMEMAGRMLPFFGGFDRNGKLTKDPGLILESRNAVPIGYWKGYGLALMLDIFSSVLSGGVSTLSMPEQGHTVSQVFIAINPGVNGSSAVEGIIQELKKNGEEVHYPGEGTEKRRAENLSSGVSVPYPVWNSIMERNAK